MDRPFPFPHQRLDAWRVAVELVTQVKTLCERIPRGYRNVADHMLRAAVNTALLLAEGANRLTAGQKGQLMPRELLCGAGGLRSRHVGPGGACDLA